MLPLGAQLPYLEEAKAAHVEKRGTPVNNQHQVPAFEGHLDPAANSYALIIVYMFGILIIIWLFF